MEDSMKLTPSVLRVLVHSKECFALAFWGFRLALGNSMLELFCDDFSPHSLTAGPEPAFYSCAWSLA